MTATFTATSGHTITEAETPSGDRAGAVATSRRPDHLEGDPMTVTTDVPAKTNAQRIDDVIDMLDLATAGESVSTSCVENARASAEVLRGEIKAGR